MSEYTLFVKFWDWYMFVVVRLPKQILAWPRRLSWEAFDWWVISEYMIVMVKMRKLIDCFMLVF